MSEPVGKEEQSGLPVSESAAPTPVFNCIVLVSRQSDGRVRARVANLADLELIASSEREALSRIIPEFKQRLAGWVQAGAAIPWIDPPLEPTETEQQRLIAVHL